MFLTSGTTSFAPIIKMATKIVDQSGGKHHVLMIISDGQVYILFTIPYVRTYVCMDVCRVIFEQITKTTRNTWLHTTLNITSLVTHQ